MTVEIEFVDPSRASAHFEDAHISKTEAHTYCYELLPQGAVLIYRTVHAMKGGKSVDARNEEVILYGPGAWRSARGARHQS